MISDIELLNSIPDGKPVRIFLPLKKGTELYRAQSVFQKITDSKFTLLFKPGVLLKDEIELSKPSIISVDMGGPTISLEALIEKVVNSQTLHMSVQKTISHEQMREFFRVDTSIKIVSKSFHNEFSSIKKEPWSVKGTTIDISGSGILALFPEKPSPERQIQLEITIPLEKPETITAIAHQVRTTQLDDGRFEVAYHFDDIDTEDRDKIIGCCLVIQRKLLRLKVQVKDTI